MAISCNTGLCPTGLLTRPTSKTGSARANQTRPLMRSSLATPTSTCLAKSSFSQQLAALPPSVLPLVLFSSELLPFSLVHLAPPLILRLAPAAGWSGLASAHPPCFGGLLATPWAETCAVTLKLTTTTGWLTLSLRLRTAMKAAPS